jgi:SAM-dependent methyltransferase
MRKDQTTLTASGLPTFGSSPSEEELSMPRAKRTPWLIPISYRIKRAAQFMLGDKRVLRICLNSSWLLRRFAYELCGEMFGPSFHNASLALSEEVLRRWIPANGTVIDIGCGTGRWCKAAAPYARSVVGIDYDEAYMEVARAKYQEPNIEYIVGDVTKDLSGRTFDVGLLIHVIEHIDDVDTLLRALHRVAATLIIEVPDFESDSLNSVRHALGCPYYSDADHVREYTLASLRQQLERNGWDIRYHEQRGGAILAVAASADS